MISRPAGFTVIELMITVALIGILMTIAAPSLRDLIRNARMTAQTNDLMTDLAIARAEAAKSGVHTGICTSNTGATCTATGWNMGWIIYRDTDGDGILAGPADIVKIAPAIDGANDSPPNTIVANAASGLPLPVAGADWIGFRPSGVAKLSAPQGTFTLCDGRTTASVGAAAASNKGRIISISQTGRAISQRSTCP